MITTFSKHCWIVIILLFRFLDNVTTDVIHYESKKLVYYPGNLSSFVETHPEAKSYYTLAATSVKFSFPSPGSLMGVRSNTRAILKMSNCTFTYPGRSTPSLFNVSCALSLSRWVTTLIIRRNMFWQSCSRVGIVGPNGAGKSTLVKLLTVRGLCVPTSAPQFQPSYRVKRSLRKAPYTNTPHFVLDTFHSTPLIISVSINSLFFMTPFSVY